MQTVSPDKNHSGNQTKLRRVCVVTATDMEFNAVTSALSHLRPEKKLPIRTAHGECGQQQVTVLMSEIGAGGFAAKLQEFLAAGCFDELLMLGLAGALDEALKVGDVVVYEKCLWFSASAWSAEGASAREKRNCRDEIASIFCHSQMGVKAKDRLKAAGQAFYERSGISTDRIIVKAADKQRWGKTFAAAAVDMESFQVLQVAAGCGVPAAVVRVISDDTVRDLPDFNQALNAEGKIHPAKAALAMAKRPLAAFSFLQGLRKSVRALHTVSQALLQD